MQDVLERLDAELRHSPEPTFDIATTLVAGRRAVRRRRLAAGAAGLAAAVALGGAAWALTPGDDAADGRGGNVAGDPGTSAAASPAPQPEPWGPDELLRVEIDGRVSVNPEAEVLEQRDFTASNGVQADLYVLAYGADEFYAVVEDTSISSRRLPAQGMSAEEWAEEQLTLRDGAPDTPWVTIDDRSRLTPEPGVSIVEQRPDPDLGANFSAPGLPTAVAEVERDGVTYFLAVRSFSGRETETITYRRDDTVPTLDAFVAYAQAQYAESPGGGSEGLR